MYIRLSFIYCLLWLEIFGFEWISDAQSIHFIKKQTDYQDSVVLYYTSGKKN